MSRRDDSKSSRMAVPALPMPCAIILCILNILVPGLGTFLSAFSMCCCGNKRDMTGGDLCIAGCIQVLIAFGQLVFTPFFLLGWIWSIIWGVAFIGQSADFYHNDPGLETPGVTTSTVGQTMSFGRVHRVQPYPGVAPPPYPGPSPSVVETQVPMPPTYSDPPPSYSEIAAPPTAPPLNLTQQQPFTYGALPHSGDLPHS